MDICEPPFTLVSNQQIESAILCLRQISDTIRAVLREPAAQEELIQ